MQDSSATWPHGASDPSLAEYRELLATVVGGNIRAIRGWTNKAEEEERFPKAFIEHLGAEGVFAGKWSQGARSDVAKLVELGFAVGSLGSLGSSAGAALQDSLIAVLKRFGKSERLLDIGDRAVRGESVLCIGASEESGGSDLSRARTMARAHDGGYRVTGSKKYVSLAPSADYVLTLASCPDPAASSSRGNLMLLAIPRDLVEVMAPYRKVSMGPLETAEVKIGTWVPEDLVVARPGAGLAAVVWGLSHERLSLAAQVVSFCELVIGVTAARMAERKQYGRPLFEHQALRLRLADLKAEVEIFRHALLGFAALGQMRVEFAAMFKARAGRLGESVVSECMHIFGGSGFLVDETPLGRWWRDVKLIRVAGGADEIMLEFMATRMLTPDFEAYRSLVPRAQAEVGTSPWERGNE